MNVIFLLSSNINCAHHKYNQKTNAKSHLFVVNSASLSVQQEKMLVSLLLLDSAVFFSSMISGFCSHDIGIFCQLLSTMFEKLDTESSSTRNSN